MKNSVSFYVAECSEFHSLGEYYEEIEDVRDAIRLWNSIPGSRMNGRKAIGVNISVEGDDLPYEADIVVGRRIDLDVLDYIPGVWDNQELLGKIADLVSNFPEFDCNRKFPKVEDIKVSEAEETPRRHRSR